MLNSFHQPGNRESSQKVFPVRMDDLYLSQKNANHLHHILQLSISKDLLSKFLLQQNRDAAIATDLKLPLDNLLYAQQVCHAPAPMFSNQVHTTLSQPSRRL